MLDVREKKTTRKMSTKAAPATVKQTKIKSKPKEKKKQPAKKKQPKKKQPATVDLWAKEKALKKKGYEFVVGCDEAGRGPLAGPVVSAACHVPLGIKVEGVTDSKAIAKEASREEIFERLTKTKGVKFAYTVLNREVIDDINILQAAMKGMADSVDKMMDEQDLPVDYVLVDGPHKPKTMNQDLPCEAIVKGDSKCHCIAAASIIAKVVRDRIMNDLDKKYPQYEFSSHKGYATPRHRELIKIHGPCEIHRHSFNPVRTMLGWTRKKKEEAQKIVG